jgi:hypothetical protein
MRGVFEHERCAGRQVRGLIKITSQSVWTTTTTAAVVVVVVAAAGV